MNKRNINNSPYITVSKIENIMDSYKWTIKIDDLIF